jgi:flavin reductase (DIM6/NTAB) family NADH-FMN oxidoreductase RutF
LDAANPAVLLGRGTSPAARQPIPQDGGIDMKIVREPYAALYPTPGVLVSCGTGAEANLIALAWAGTLCSVPPMVGIGVRPSRLSHSLIKDLGEFVVNMPTAAQARLLDYCGHVSGREQNKWTTCGFTPEAGAKVRVPLVQECPVNLECVVRAVHTLGSHDLFIGEVVAVHLDTTVTDEHGRFITEQAHPLACVEGHYYRLGELIGTYGFSQRQS